MTERILGVVGGSGLYDLPGLEDAQSVSIDTPFGSPSDAFRVGRMGETKVVFIARHGRGHRVMPGEINYRANIWGLKKLGCDGVISVTAVGSMKEEIAPGDFVIVDQFFDRTRARPSTFFGGGVVAHVGLADPVCSELSDLLEASARETDGGLHRGGTYICIEGPAFSTRAESRIFRQWGVDVIGMTNLPEARLAREAELCYAVMALATDYDCWHEAEDDVSAPAVIAVMKKNVERAKAVIASLARSLPPSRQCSCGTALDGAIMSDIDAIPPETKDRLDLLLARRLAER
ncbi:MAG: S-methyl-5'-thioadenosine phosphorylase [Myxococcota bacterium]